ncbi:MAG: TMEM165/GDT1 family protein [Nanoarchaeota archaeon]|nr:TMEM165/GDT1 family protein [Nanoarchaeota archaeon]
MMQDFLIPFIAISIAELGDKTQIASGLFATQYNPWLVLLGVLSAMTLLSIRALLVGKFIFTKINKNRHNNCGPAFHNDRHI